MSSDYPYTGFTKEHWQEWHWRLRDLLNTAWDPIGVGPPDGVDDEYDSYVNGIEALWQRAEGDFKQQLVSYLAYVEEEWMGLGSSPLRHERLRDVAGKILFLGVPPNLP